eukprot:363351-Chlamydomonas_euryale.AAC.6
MSLVRSAVDPGPGLANGALCHNCEWAAEDRKRLRQASVTLTVSAMHLASQARNHGNTSIWPLGCNN